MAHVSYDYQALVNVIMNIRVAKKGETDSAAQRRCPQRTLLQALGEINVNLHTLIFSVLEEHAMMTGPVLSVQDMMCGTLLSSSSCLKLTEVYKIYQN